MSKVHHLWSEEYRPRTIDDCILPDRMKEHFKEMVATGKLQNMTLVGPPGTGKTTVARALCNELKIDYLLINASENGNIDTIRTEVRRFASTVSVMNDAEIKCIILDESDYLNPSSSQPALRGAIEEFSAACRFIFTANYGNRIIEPLKSRAPVVDFTFTKEEKKSLILQFDARVRSILEAKQVTFDRRDLAQLIVKHFPDFRRILNLLQRFSNNGMLAVGSNVGMSETAIGELVGFLKDKKFGDMRKWVAENIDNDGAMIRRALYDRMLDIITPDSVPQLVLFINEYDYKESFVVDKEINTVAFLTSCMADIAFK